MIGSQFLVDVGNSYIEFLDKAGKADGPYFKEEVPKLFASKCAKIVNGDVKFESRDAFQQYFMIAQERYGNWHIRAIKPLYSCLDESTVTIKFIAETSKIKLLVFAVLKIDREGMIHEIDEVDTPIDDLTADALLK